MFQLPFPIRFAEKMPSVDVTGEYDEQMQVFRSANPSSLMSGPTFIETATGGYGDTDTDTMLDP